MSDDEFQEIGPRTRNGRTAEFNITIKCVHDKHGFYVSKSLLTMRAVRALALGRDRFISIAITPSGRVRIRPAVEVTTETARIGLEGSVPRIASYCRERGYRDGVYPVEVRDGALYFQLERIEQEDAA